MPSLDAGNLRTLAIDLDEQRRHLDRRAALIDEREARLIGVEAIEALRLSQVLANEAGLGGRMGYSPIGMTSSMGGAGRLAATMTPGGLATSGGGMMGGSSMSMRPSTAPGFNGGGGGADWVGGCAAGAAADAGDVFAAPRFRSGMFGGTGSVYGGNVPSRGAAVSGGRGQFNPGSKHPLMSDVPMSGAVRRCRLTPGSRS